MDFSAIPRETVLGRALRAPLSLIPRGLTVPILQGPLRGTRWIVGAGPNGCWLGSYETETQRALVKAIRPGMTVFDVGANVGFFSLLAARLGGRVIAFEPLPRNAAVLRRHVEMNDSDVTVEEAAIFDRSGLESFVEADSVSMGRLGEGTLFVRTTTIAEAASIHGVPDLVKMDIEGGEVVALTAAEDFLSAHRPTLFLSTHGWNRHETCMALLARCGYTVTDVGRESSPGNRDVIAQ